VATETGLKAMRSREKTPGPGRIRPLLQSHTGYISQLERGIKQPKGPALALLNVIKRKGFETILQAER
jgi:putative transcriptional regulator